MFHFLAGKAVKNILVSNNVFYVGADIHKKIKRVVGDPLSRENLKNDFEIMESICLEILDGWYGKKVSIMDGTSSVSKRVFTLYL